ncbi:MAG: mannose-6-phosphate isomerase, class I [Lachnospiraceae bacterium]|nr:mannose-6-phosphate isomerase, class I [Lachnospiraceae bacterium]
MGNMILLEPVFKEVLWGGSKLNTVFGYDIPSDHTGEGWVISAHKSGDCRIAAGEYKGHTLSWLWDSHRELFGNLPGEVFPLLVKIIDAKDHLSIQVHPDDAYAAANENGSLGKTECWYVLDCEPDSTIVVGHNAKTKEELKQMIDDRRWMDLIKIRPLHKGDFFQINPGTVHAIRGGSLILEIQQSSDITYRLYDYDRLQNGQPRELHLAKSIDVITCPYEEQSQEHETVDGEGFQAEKMVKCPFYSVTKVHVTKKVSFEQDQPFLMLSIIDGEGTIDGTAVKKGMNLILPCGYGTYTVEGDVEFMVSGVN